MGTKVPYDAVPYKSKTGDILNPGDPAVAVTTSAGQGALRFGKYLGIRNGGCVMEVQKDGQKFVNAAGEVYDFNAEWKAWPYRYELRYGTPEYFQYQNESDAGRKKMREGYDWVEYTYTGTTQLRNNNIYPGDVALRAIEL